MVFNWSAHPRKENIFARVIQAFHYVHALAKSINLPVVQNSLCGSLFVFFRWFSPAFSRNYLVHPDPFFQRLLSQFLTGCPPLLIVRLAAKSLWLQVCHTFCIAENGNNKSAKPLCLQHRSFPPVGTVSPLPPKLQLAVLRPFHSALFRYSDKKSERNSAFIPLFF